MSLESTATIKGKLAAGLGHKAPRYWSIFQAFLSAKISRNEFDEEIRQCVDTSQLVQLHNALIISIFDPSAHLVPFSPPPDAPKGPPRKRRRLLPYQGPDPHEPTSLRSARLKRWIVGVGRRERERIRNFEPVALTYDKQPRPEEDEIARERGVQLLPERGDPPGSRPALHLASSARGFTLQHITDRINLICAQHNLSAPSKNVSSLMALAFETKLKQLISQALALTTASHAITSIHPSAPHSTGNRLSASAFDTLFTVSPAVLPSRSAAAMRLALGDNEPRDDEVLTSDRREPNEPSWQLLALLRERSAVNQSLQSWRLDLHGPTVRSKLEIAHNARLTNSVLSTSTSFTVPLQSPTVNMVSEQPTVFRWGVISTGQIATAFAKASHRRDYQFLCICIFMLITSINEQDMLVNPKSRDVRDIVHKVVAVGSRSAESAQNFIDKVIGGDNAIKAYGSYAEVYADPDVDAVYIGTPHTYHYVNACEAIKAKKHVLVEKPATTNAAEFKAMTALAREHGVFLMEAMWTRFQPVSRSVRRIIDEGTLGDPVMVHADLSGDFDIDNIPKTHRILDPQLGGGALLDLGPYPLVWAIISLYEQPINNRELPTVSASIVKTPLTGVDRTSTFILTFPPLAAQASLSCSINIPPCNPGATIRFRNGNILIPSPIYCPKSYTVQYFDRPGSGTVEREETVHVSFVGGGWHFQADEVARCVKSGKLESMIWGHDKTLLAMTVFDEVRRQGGYVLPEGVEKVN
ncbi:hypothetical protein EW146_g6766 [Bondarzewia mesenterica]|uniref:D-xylose 1-dehydrogenase (NADP(+), D-xylono-1,5-lactone-forming) n=1 Tax=Bondarzewia mesenterica TaxID=1095465 RepID=A0A4V6S1D8_9AGAM|nr:hypothetical protein EW146_g6766 [Bondarzewia mesenterica]